MPLTEEEKREITERVYEHVVDTLMEDGKITQIVYDEIAKDVGRSIIRKALWLLGLAFVGLLAWAATKLGIDSVVK